ncbi:Replication factor C, subunit RFC4 [Coemansia nantahalensis]|uniref:Replication factor C, subunit RFC4 n=2 Tax=Coemansia TaxID=4863 RepID=A0ACC1L8W9_9FUNG|nr:Replication factor C, subunit RFC4 [Coemansia nantahalensis]KAJ2768802.1 Replication factor C, subunit RFC4 [Coemansia nantahalensis]KAJ2803233.1 Replication factor C, subunit RFC4 [Coemansia helicoidea]
MSTRDRQEAQQAELEKIIVSNSYFALGTALAGTAVLSAIAYRFSPAYRRMPISARTALLIGPPLGAFYIRGEHVGSAYRRSLHAHQLEGEERDRILRDQQASATRQGLANQAIEFVTTNRWSILGTTWLTGITGSLFYLYRQKGMSASQKLVQARMYAQLITIFGILSTAAIASMSGKSENKSAQHNSAALNAILAADTKIDTPTRRNAKDE